jgi:hypothetical protein
MTPAGISYGKLFPISFKPFSQKGHIDATTKTETDALLCK